MPNSGAEPKGFRRLEKKGKSSSTDLSKKWGRAIVLGDGGSWTQWSMPKERRAERKQNTGEERDLRG